VILILIFAFASFQLNKIRKNSETLWTYIIEKGSKSDMPFANRSGYYMQQGALDKGIADLEDVPSHFSFHGHQKRSYFALRAIPVIRLLY
jgi:hypothetical protein